MINCDHCNQRLEEHKFPTVYGISILYKEVCYHCDYCFYTTMQNSSTSKVHSRGFIFNREDRIVLEYKDHVPFQMLIGQKWQDLPFELKSIGATPSDILKAYKRIIKSQILL